MSPQTLRLFFHDRPLGLLRSDPAQQVHALQFDPSFMSEGHDLSPLKLPKSDWGNGYMEFRPSDSPFACGLPGLIADSLPDRWGERMLREEVPAAVTPLDKLAAIGRRGPGAISFEPILGSFGADSTGQVATLASLARDAERLRAAPLTTGAVDAALARGGSPLGGMFPKIATHLSLALIGEKIPLQDVMVGGPPPAGHAPCILKLARDDGDSEGAVEFAFWRLAKSAGLRVPDACLVTDGARAHFASVRFDRYTGPDGRMLKRHVHTLSGMLGKRPADGEIDYRDFMRLTRRLCGAPEAEECFRRAVFNLLTTNRDDHGRNHAYLYDERTRAWALSPAYDLNPNLVTVLIGLAWMGRMTVPVSQEEVLALAAEGGVSDAKARAIFQEVTDATTVEAWHAEAEKAGVPPPIIAEWAGAMKRAQAPLAQTSESAPLPGLVPPSRRGGTSPKL